uniref:Uncharacterized protein n=1 Tax=Xenopus tropicalis TaxID=8364 RepID=A0A1B8XUK8_XENTR
MQQHSLESLCLAVQEHQTLLPDNGRLTLYLSAVLILELHPSMSAAKSLTPGYRSAVEQSVSGQVSLWLQLPLLPFISLTLHNPLFLFQRIFSINIAMHKPIKQPYIKLAGASFSNRFFSEDIMQSIEVRRFQR